MAAVQTYALTFKNRLISEGDIASILLHAQSRGAIVECRPSQRGYRWSRLLVDLKPDYEIRPVVSEQ